jgi:hypothetical protein
LKLKKRTSISEELKLAGATTGPKRGGYGGDQAPAKKTKYQKELSEIREELPEEIKEFAEVFCKGE